MTASIPYVISVVACLVWIFQNSKTRCSLLLVGGACFILAIVLNYAFMDIYLGLEKVTVETVRDFALENRTTIVAVSASIEELVKFAGLLFLSSFGLRKVTFYSRAWFGASFGLVEFALKIFGYGFTYESANSSALLNSVFSTPICMSASIGIHTFLAVLYPNVVKHKLSFVAFSLGAWYHSFYNQTVLSWGSSPDSEWAFHNLLFFACMPWIAIAIFAILLSYSSTHSKILA